MKTIVELKGADFLRACNKVRHSVSDLLVKSDVISITKEQPVLTGEETPEEKEKILTENGKSKINRILDLLLDKYAEETSVALMNMCILEDGEDPDGLDLVMAGLEIVTSPKMLDFFTRLMKSANLLGVG